MEEIERSCDNCQNLCCKKLDDGAFDYWCDVDNHKIEHPTKGGCVYWIYAFNLEDGIIIG